MKEWKQFSIGEDVQNEFDVERLMVLASTHRRGTKWGVPTRNHTPAEYLFNRVGFEKDGDDYLLTRKIYDRVARKVVSKAIGRLRPSTQGGEWVYYNNEDIDQATSRLVLAKGGDNDLYSAEMRLAVVKVGDVHIVRNTSTINGVLWSETPIRGEIGLMSASWYLRNIEDGQLRQGGFIPLYAPINYNIGGVRPEFVKLTTNPDVPSTLDYKGVSDLDTWSADYCVKEEDLTDPDHEKLVLTMYHGTKQTVRNFGVSLKQILSVK